MTGQGFPCLQTDRLILRELSMDDVPAVFRNYADPAVVRYIMDPLTDIEEARDFVLSWIEDRRQGKGLVWAITLRLDGAFIGTCGFEEFCWPNRSGEIGYDISPPFWGKGMMTEALQAVLDYGFGALGLNRIEARSLVANARSVLMLRRLGFARERTTRQRKALSGKLWDQGLFSLLRQDWEAHRGMTV